MFYLYNTYTDRINTLVTYNMYSPKNQNYKICKIEFLTWFFNNERGLSLNMIFVWLFKKKNRVNTISV